MKRKLSLLLIVVLLVASLSGCNSSDTTDVDQPDNTDSGEVQADPGEDEEEKVLIVASSSEPLHYNTNAVDAGSSYPSANIYSTLFKLSVTNVIVPDLANTYEVTEDGLTYTFHLVDNAKWHDGEKFTSEDVKWTYEAILSEKGMNYERLSCIEEITCPDDKTVIFNLSNRNAAFISLVTRVSILAEHLYAGTDWLDNPANQSPIGTGPFKFVEHKKGVNVTLEAFDDYFKGVPKIDRIVYKTIPDQNVVVQSYLNGEVDIIDLAAAISPSAMPIIESQPNTKIQTMISADRQYMVTNLANEPWSNVKVRQAISYAVDRPDLVAKAHKGYAEVAEGFYTPAISWAYTDEYKMPDRDIEKAKQLLDEAGYLPDENGVRIKDAEIVIFQFAVFSDIATIVQANLKEIGIESSITTLEYAAWDERLNEGKFDIAIIGGYHGPDPEGMIIRVGTGGLLNFMNYSSPVVDGLLEQGVQTSIVEERAVIYKDLQKVLSEELPILPLTEWCYIIVTRDNITGHPLEESDRAGAADYFYLDIK